MGSDEQAAEGRMDPDNLYREEIFTDREVGTIRQLTPVDTNGAADPQRRVLYIGQAQLLTPMGALPLSFELSADSLDEAVAQFPEAAQVAVENALDELKELRRDAASSIVIPETGGASRGGAGGLPGRGKIQLP